MKTIAKGLVDLKAAMLVEAQEVDRGQRELQAGGCLRRRYELNLRI